MKKLEKTLVIITSVALILKYLSVPGMSLFVVIGLLGLAILYFYLGFALFNGIEFRKMFVKDSYLQVSKPQLFYAIGVGISLSIICVGMLFKIQHWFGSTLYLYTGLTLAFVLLVITLINFNKSKGVFFRLLLIRLIPYSLLGVLALIIKI